MVVNNAISPLVVGVTTIDNSPQVEEATEIRGLDREGILVQALQSHTPILLAAARALLRNEANALDLVQTTLDPSDEMLSGADLYLP